MTRIRCYWLLALPLICLPLQVVGAPAPSLEQDEGSLKMAPVATPSPEEIETSIHHGIEFLLEHQNQDGSWGSADSSRPKEVYAPIPGAHHAFRAAVTALCISALIETGGDDPRVLAALDRAEAWLLKNLSHVRRATPDTLYNSWTHAYGIQALVKMLDRKPEDTDRADRIRALIAQQINMLQRYEVIDGGWAYYDFGAGTRKPSGSTMSFVTAAVLVALRDAEQAGIEVPRPMVDRAMESIRRQRKPDFSYLYGEYLKWRPMRPVNRPGGSLGRSQACNVAMQMWGDPLTTDAVIETWLDRLFSRNLWLDIGRKRPTPHEAWFSVAGYFFYFGHYYAGLCIERLPESKQGPFQDHLAHVLLGLQEKDGSWWDFPFYDYHQPYGTAFALMSLQRSRRVEL